MASWTYKYQPTPVIPAVQCCPIECGLIPSPGIIVWGNSAPPGQVGVPYSYGLGIAPDSMGNFSATSLPPGVTLSAGGIFSGTPTTAGTYNTVVTLTNANGAISQTIPIIILPP